MNLETNLVCQRLCGGPRDFARKHQINRADERLVVLLEGEEVLCGFGVT